MFYIRLAVCRYVGLLSGQLKSVEKLELSDLDETRCQFHQRSMNSFCASIFTLILLAEEHKAWKLSVTSSWVRVMVKLGVVLLVK